MADQFLAERVNQILYNFIVSRGGVPSVTDLDRMDAYPILLGQAQALSPGASFAQIVSSNSLSTFTAEAAFTAATPSDVQFTIPAGALNAVGRVCQFSAFGTLGSTGTPTFTLGARLGGIAGTLVASTGAMATALNSVTAGWMIEGSFIVRQAGATGIIAIEASTGWLVNTTAVAGALVIHGGVASVTAAVINLTVAQTFVFTAACSASNVANAIVMLGSQVALSGPAS
ncbi:MAG: hypothetical protein ACRD2L_11060 [Terriglobia bacterium]